MPFSSRPLITRLLLALLAPLTLIPLAGTALPIVRAAGVVALSRERLIYSELQGGAASAPQAVTISNSGDADLTISSLTITGADADLYTISNFGGLPGTLAPGAAATVNVTFNPPNGSANIASGSTDPNACPVKVAALQIQGEGISPASVALRGLPTKAVTGDGEPPLQCVFQAQQIPVNVGDTDLSTAALTTTFTLMGDEIGAQYFQKADPAEPVTIEPIATYGPPSGGLTLRFGWYVSGNTAGRQELFTVSDAFSQTLSPVATAAGGSTITNNRAVFDPGNRRFGIFSQWPNFANRLVYQEDLFNLWDTRDTGNLRHKVRVYPYRTAGGSAVPNTYVAATEEHNGAGDNQDIVVILRNVKIPGSAAAPSAANLNLEFDQGYPGTLTDRDGQTIGFVGTQANKNDTPTTTVSYDPNQLNINPAAGTLTITTTRTSSAQSQFNDLINALQLPFNAADEPFTITTRLLPPFNLLDNTHQGGIFFGPDQGNFIKVVAARLSDQNVIELYREFYDTTTSSGAGGGNSSVKVNLPALNTIQALDLHLIADPATGQVRGAYSINTGSGFGPLTTIDTITLAGLQRARYFDRSSWAGLTVSGRLSTARFVPFTFDRFAIKGAADVQPTETPVTPTTTTPTTVTPTTPTSTTPTTATPTTPTSTTPTSTTPTSTAPTTTTPTTPTTSPTTGPGPDYDEFVYIPLIST